MQQDGGEQKDLHLGNLLSNASPLACGENHHAVGQVLIQISVGIQEPGRVEDVRVSPLLRVVIDRPLINEHHGVFGDAKTLDGHV